MIIRMKDNKYFKHYCTGCGLCQSVVGTKMVRTDKGFLEPNEITEKDSEFMKNICMASGAYWKSSSEFKVWGTVVEQPFYAYSSDPIVRKKASSGGVVSEIAIYLLENHLVDGIIETRVSFNSVIKTQVVVNCSKEEILNCLGSRYTISSPLSDVHGLLEPGKKYAFIGKPCDVIAVRNWKNMNADINDRIPYLISFMCAGMPSRQAEEKLLSQLNTSENECDELVYRGNGWPGYTVARSKNEETGRMTYADSWGKILGRDVATACRFCYDGIGEAADIACGDGWYVEDGKPDFNEHDGRNIVFVRTTTGKRITDAMLNSKAITCIPSEKPYEELIQIQNYQFTRRTTMREKLLALKISGRTIPNYSKTMMRQLGKEASLKSRIRIFMGTIKRLHEGKI